MSIREIVRKLNKLHTIKEVYDFVKENKFEFIGSGSSRSAYRISKHRVLKLVKYSSRIKGLAQNEHECKFYAEFPKKELLTKILYNCNKFNWIIAEYVKPVNYRDNKKCYLCREEIESLDSTLCEVREFGIVGKQLKLLDFGCSNEIYLRYY